MAAPVPAPPVGSPVARTPGSLAARPLGWQFRHASLCRNAAKADWSSRCGRLPTRASSDDAEPVDIDELARKLTEEAERLRRAESGKQASSSGGGGGPAGQYDADDPIFGVQAARQHEELLASVDGGFEPGEFEILQQLGQLSWVTEAAKESPLQVAAASTEQVPAIVAFAARYYSGGPFQDPVQVLLKEFLPVARPVGCNELRIATTLSPPPDFKWQAAAAALSADPPVTPLLGHFIARQSETGASISEGASSSDESDDDSSPAAAEALWLVYKWERLQPLTFYPLAEQPKARRGVALWGGGDGEAEALRDRCRMLRMLARGAVAALAFCHGRGVSHGSLGTGSLLLSTYEDRRAGELLVKLTNFGFARQRPPEPPLAAGAAPGWQRDDLQALGLVLLEAIFAALAEEGAAPAESLKRLVLEVFGGRTDDFRQYLAQEASWTTPGLLLDQFGSSGWALLDCLLAGKRTAADLLATNAFLSPD